jgi:hypothetical protein
MYLDPGRVGVNQFHVIFSGPGADASSAVPIVTAGTTTAPSQRLRQLKVGPGHYTDFVVLQPGHWDFRITARLDGRTVHVPFTRVLP